MHYYPQVTSEIQRPLSEVTREIRQFLERSGKTQSQLSAETGINQSTIHRAIQPKKGRRRTSRALRQLCNYASISLTKAADIDPAGNQELMKALRLAWDGTEAHAQALARFLHELGKLTAGRLEGVGGAHQQKGNRKNG